MEKIYCKECKNSLVNIPIGGYCESCGVVTLHSEINTAQECRIEFGGNTEIINLTPHDITLCGTSYPSQGIARVSTVERLIGEVNGIPIKAVCFGEVVGLPEREVGKILVVSALVAGAVKNRGDVYSLGSFVRNDKGQIIGAEALITANQYFQ